MGLRLESWIDLAKTLDPNARKYFNHVDCGAGKTLVVSHDASGYSAHCFRCNLDGFAPHGVRNLAELHNANFGLLQKHDRNFETSKCELPNDFTKEIPDYAALWLYKAGIYKSTAQDYGFGWSDHIKRIVLPVYDKGALVYMQARSIDGRKPKYLNNAALCKASVLFKSGMPYKPQTQLSGTCIVTEDILSSVRVGVLTTSCSTLGTQLSTEQAHVLSRDFERVLFWYDGDKAGIKGSLQGLRTLRLLGVDARRIETLKDPKCYSNREMLSILQQGAT